MRCVRVPLSTSRASTASEWGTTSTCASGSRSAEKMTCVAVPSVQATLESRRPQPRSDRECGGCRSTEWVVVVESSTTGMILVGHSGDVQRSATGTGTHVATIRTAPNDREQPEFHDVVLKREHGTSLQGHGEGWAPPTSRDGSRSAPLGRRGRLEPPGFRGRRRRVLGRPHGRPPRCQRRPKVDPPSTRRRHRVHVAPQPRRGSSVAEPRTHGLTKRPVVSRSN
jgi:hypothetical protein